ncbi:MAG: helix-turn-helix domain-containing protein [Cellulosilyticaceae bacterium]
MFNESDIWSAGRKIKSERKAKGLTQQKLAEKSGVTEASIRNYEQGKYIPTLFNILLIAEVLDLSIDYLVGRIAKEEGAI